MKSYLKTFQCKIKKKNIHTDMSVWFLFKILLALLLMIEQTEIEKYVIEKVKEIRIAHNISQANLARLLDVSEGFIGNIENPKYRDKYNLNHLNQLAKIFKCSPKDFLPEVPL